MIIIADKGSPRKRVRRTSDSKTSATAQPEEKTQTMEPEGDTIATGDTVDTTLSKVAKIERENSEESCLQSSSPLISEMDVSKTVDAVNAGLESLQRIVQQETGRSSKSSGKTGRSTRKREEKKCSRVSTEAKEEIPVSKIPETKLRRSTRAAWRECSVSSSASDSISTRVVRKKSASSSISSTPVVRKKSASSSISSPPVVRKKSASSSISSTPVDRKKSASSSFSTPVVRKKPASGQRSPSESRKLRSGRKPSKSGIKPEGLVGAKSGIKSEGVSGFTPRVASRYLDDSDASSTAGNSQSQRRSSAKAAYRIVFCHSGINNVEKYEKVRSDHFICLFLIGKSY